MLFDAHKLDISDEFKNAIQVRNLTARFISIITINNTSKTDVAPWCYKWDWMDGWMDGWKSPGGGMYRAPYGANNEAQPPCHPQPMSLACPASSCVLKAFYHFCSKYIEQ